nr:nucleotide-binding, alpha-beta plait [Tanacetum cinerariifolium]
MAAMSGFLCHHHTHNLFEQLPPRMLLRRRVLFRYLMRHLTSIARAGYSFAGRNTIKIEIKWVLESLYMDLKWTRSEPSTWMGKERKELDGSGVKKPTGYGGKVRHVPADHRGSSSTASTAATSKFPWTNMWSTAR